MSASQSVDIHIDLARIQANARALRSQAAVPVIAVVKADAYGHGIIPVTEALGGLVDEFCVFTLSEAVDAGIWERTQRRTLVIGPPLKAVDPDAYVEHRARPAVSNADEALQLIDAGPVLCVDTGMQRFACPPERLEEVIRAGDVTEAYTHAMSIEQAARFEELTKGLGLRTRHAAGSSLLGEPAARFDAVRPGMALYRGAARITTRLVEVRESKGPIGYSRWRSETGRHGVILAGYSNGLRPGPSVVNEQPRRIAEVGMQSSFVELGPGDAVGDEVVLLGDGLSEEQVGKAWSMSPHETLVRLCGLGVRRHTGD